MGRELKRVPMDFNWPINKVWGGFINPFYRQSIQCPNCEGDGYSQVAHVLKERWYGNVQFKPEDRGSVPYTPNDPAVRVGRSTPDAIADIPRLCRLFNGAWMHHLNADDVAALVEANRLHDLTHHWVAGEGWVKNDPFVIPTPKQVNDWSLCFMGHDSINRSVVIAAECKRLGVGVTCPRCKGTGTLWPTPEIEKACEDWKPTEPPEGDGYQIWETVSEGSPISPVFATPEELAEHMSHTSWGADKGSPKEAWMQFILGPGWAPSMVMCDGVIKTGPNAIP